MVLLHWAVFRATCLTKFKSVALQLHEQGCYTVQWDCQQLAKLRPRRTEERIIRILIGWSSKALREKLRGRGREGVLHCATLKKSMKLLLQSLRKVESSSTFYNACRNKKMRDKLLSRYVTLGNFRCNLRHSKIVRQVAWKVASSNSALKLHVQ